MPGFSFNERLYNNPVELALHVIGGKWKMPIVWRLRKGAMRYGELKRSLGRITHKMLTQQLRELESHGLVHREVHEVVPPRVEYSLTDRGRSVIPVIEQLREWGRRFLRETSSPV